MASAATPTSTKNEAKGPGGILNISFEFSKKIGTRQLPELSKEYESTVPGLYIVGDLADAPVIKIALNQGYDIAKKIAAKSDARSGDPDVLDLVIVGAGPAGVGAAMACKEAGLSYRVIERERPFNTVQNYPKHKHVFAEPRPILAKSGLWFEDSLKEELVARWEKAIDEHSLQIDQPVEVTDIKRSAHGFNLTTKGDAGGKKEYRARRVMLCIGRRGTVRKMGCTGEELDKVCYGLGDPDKYRDQDIVVVGGGDSAVESMLALCDRNRVVAIHRSEDFSRAKPANKRKIDAAVAAGKLRVEFKAKVASVTESDITLQKSDGSTETLPNQQVFVLIGTELPLPFLAKIGVKMEGTWDAKRITWLVCSMIIAYLFYAMKEQKAWFPWTPRALEAIKIHGFGRTFDGGFIGTVIYSCVITIFGVQAARRYPSSYQKKRFASLILSQWFLLFLIPEFVVPAVMKLAHASAHLINNSWRFYGVVLPWPLFTYNVDAANAAGDGGSMFWLSLGGIVTLVIIPLVAVFHGKRFCTWVCGCGGLAETLGDRWRHLAPKSDNALKMEKMGSVVLLICAVMSAILVNDTYHFIKVGGLSSVKAFKANYYDLAVDFWLSGAIPVGLYPIFGGKIWCRFWCPLAKYMQFISKHFGKLAIKSNESCIGCGQCTRYCQVGIDVQSFSQRGKEFSNATTSCIQCGICIEVCPMDVLSFGKRSPKLVILDDMNRPQQRAHA